MHTYHTVVTVSTASPWEHLVFLCACEAFRCICQGACSRLYVSICTLKMPGRELQRRWCACCWQNCTTDTMKTFENSDTCTVAEIKAGTHFYSPTTVWASVSADLCTRAEIWCVCVRAHSLNMGSILLPMHKSPVLHAKWPISCI